MGYLLWQPPTMVGIMRAWVDHRAARLAFADPCRIGIEHGDVDARGIHLPQQLVRGEDAGLSVGRIGQAVDTIVAQCRF